MSIKLLYITNNPDIAIIAQKAGVDWIFVDLEYIGKDKRQANRNTVISKHSIEDVIELRKVISSSKLLVRVNPIGNYSENEIEKVIESGADIIMLPFFKTQDEVKKFISIVNGRVKTCLLLETLEAIEILDEILNIEGVDFIHIGLNDIHIARKTTFMFEFLAEGNVDKIASKIKKKGIPFGFGGMARIGELLPPGEDILAEHYRIGSSSVILSRSFCDFSKENNLKEFEELFTENVALIREKENELSEKEKDFFEKKRVSVINDVYKVVSMIKENNNL